MSNVLRAALHDLQHLDDEDRVEFIEELKGICCLYCGELRDEKDYACQCRNDE